MSRSLHKNFIYQQQQQLYPHQKQLYPHPKQQYAHSKQLQSNKKQQMINSSQNKQTKSLLNRKNSLKTIHTITSSKPTIQNYNLVKKLSLHKSSTLRNFKQTEQQTNQLYQQNQKLGYRINYLSDQNNFYRISINNIEQLYKQKSEKLNNKIKKDLDTNKISQQKQQLSTNIITNNLNVNQPLNTLQQQKEQWMNGGWKGSSLKLISNKIHLKNLQMKVGNSIRQTQKLKRIYQGSLTSLTKKAQDLQDQINKLARQCQYYRIQAQLLSNIYKADFYITFNSDWLTLYQSINIKTKSQLQSIHQINKHSINQQNPIIQQHSNNLLSQKQSNNFNQQQESFQLQKFINPIHQLNFKPKKKQRNTEENKRNTEENKRVTEQNKRVTEEYKRNNLIASKKNYQMSQRNTQTNNNNNYNNTICMPTHFNNHQNKRLTSNNNNISKMNPPNEFNTYESINLENYPMAIRFLSFSYKHNIIGSSNNSKSNAGWYSTLYPKSKVNKLLSIIDSQSFNKKIQTNHFSTLTNNNLPFNNKQYTHKNKQCTQNNNQYPPTAQYMTEKQLFQLPQSLVQFVLTSLQKQQIQQNNKLQSLRKQQKEQRKNNFQLAEKILVLSNKKRQLKRVVDEEFAQFFIKNVQRLDIISSAVNNTINNNNASYKNTIMMAKINNMNKSKSNKQSSLLLKTKQSAQLANNNYKKQQLRSNKYDLLNPVNNINMNSLKSGDRNSLNNCDKNSLNNGNNEQRNLSINERKNEADQLLICGLYQRQLIEQINRQQTLLEQQFRINQQYKQKIIDRNQQQSKEIKVLQEEVNKCHEQLNQLTTTYKLVIDTKYHQNPNWDDNDSNQLKS